MSDIDQNQSMEGQYLIAMPTMEDGRFAHSVIYLCAHSEEGAMGIILNDPAENINFSQLLSQLNILPQGDEFELPHALRNMKVYQGGPVDTGRGFVLHSDDFFIKGSSLRIEDGICLTATLEILRALAEGRGPSRALLALGYAGWAPGQLESEIQANGWLTCKGDPSLVFEVQDHDKWQRALQILGIDPGMLSSQAGHA
ncbi:YqgE/AlgH family protein [Polycladidibacter hongkongensis]|uniref:YqgE/AlgH family protein n=1 Tax=Polycladidibacter hongkongensis TaxID=1647556 RepID=UPI0008327D2E|nr:YqgE/AlgH family protein [Pseudovibrio hongkongensis]